MVERARELVPEATFLRGDIAEVDFAPAAFDAVVSFYALIHVRSGCSSAATWWHLRRDGGTRCVDRRRD
jgi:hypothetical protein